MRISTFLTMTALVVLLAVVALRWLDPALNIYMASEWRRTGNLEREWIPLADMSAHLPRAAVAAEDAKFCAHSGFDFEAIRLALDGGARRGGSTITQQTAKNVFLWQERSWLRKGLEAGFALLIEAAWGKQRIVEVYLNIAEFDESVFGVGGRRAALFRQGRGGCQPGRGVAADGDPAQPQGPLGQPTGQVHPAPRPPDRRGRRDDPGRRARRLLSVTLAPGSRLGQNAGMRRLYHLPLSPFCRKIRLVLAEKRIEIELVEEHPWDERMDFLRMNPAGQVPVLRMDGLTLADSTAILEYLEETHPTPSLLPGDAAARAEARRLTAWFDDKFHREVTANLLYERVNKRLAKAGYPDSEKIKAGVRNIKLHIDYIGWLMESRRWLAGDHMTIADFAAAAHLSVLDYIGDVDWTRSEPMRDWYAKVKSRPAFRSLLADLVPGFAPPEHYADLDF